ncbi:hypothetical protein BMF94_0799 [Rhodotorula taiwanensis]|uniref:Uncharacterized protein n=1 Tax=Rhodotorula taiwanensis TaxID=741276 RepID=A0A2S5BH19_9BASI|nr:hypothetical protein BMF94_0799 [Rhodotorula taiwanensis]
MAAVESTTVASPHLDLISAVAFSPLGSHLATASLDHHVRVTHPSPNIPGAWDYHPRTWKAHDGAVLSLAWVDPEFGTAFASGGVDGVVKVWRQDTPPPKLGQTAAEANRSAPGKASSTAGPGWALAASLTDSRGTVRSISFAPSHFGLKVAAIASDSHLRIWDCLDPTGALREWTLVEDIDLGALGLAPSTGAGGGASSSYAGGSAVSGAAGYDVGSATGSSYGATGSATSGNAAFPSASSAASSANYGSSAAGSSVGYGGGNARAGGTVESDGGWAVSWCPEHWWGERLAVSSGPNGIVRLFHFPPSGPWHNYLNLIPSRLALSQGVSTHGHTTASSHAAASEDASQSAFSTASSAGSSSDPSGREQPASSTHTPPTSSLAFAPPSGRSYLLLAAGARDGRARVWRIVPPPLSLPSASSSTADHRQSGDGGGGDGEDGLELDGEWSARLEVELEPSLGERDGAQNGRGGATAASGGAGGGPIAVRSALGGAMSAVKVEWNILGTVLSTTGGEDGKVRLWKPTYTGQWRQIAVLSTQDAGANGSAT